MPIYEFVCKRCSNKFSVLVRSFSASSVHGCPECGCENVDRVMSAFAYHRSAGDVQQEAGEPTLIPRLDYYKDPRNVGRWTEKRFKQMGLDLPPKISHQIQAAREGEAPGTESEMLGL